MIHEADHVGRHLQAVERVAVRLVALSVAAIVERDHLVVLGELPWRRRGRLQLAAMLAANP